MRTSASQFELMVSFMERHGDLSRPNDGPQGKITNMQRWRELVNLLNADAVGETKTEEKWRKTWSDLKNNTKRKAAKLNKAVSGTGGGPACRIKLTDIEERVLAIMNPQSATGMMGVAEVGVEDEQQDQGEQLVVVEIAESPHGGDDNIQESWNIPSTSRSQPVFPPELPEINVNRNVTPISSSQPAPQGQTPPATRHSSPQRRRRDRRRNIVINSPRRRPGTQSELARQTFVNSDREWREFRISQEQRAHELERERLRLREIELQQQARWQELFAQFLLVLEKVSDNILNKDK